MVHPFGHLDLSCRGGWKYWVRFWCFLVYGYGVCTSGTRKNNGVDKWWETHFNHQCTKTKPSCQCDSDFSRFPIKYVLDIFGPTTKSFFGFSCTLRSPGPEPVGLPGVLRWSREPDTMRARTWDEGHPVRHLGSWEAPEPQIQLYGLE